MAWFWPLGKKQGDLQQQPQSRQYSLAEIKQSLTAEAEFNAKRTEEYEHARELKSGIDELKKKTGDNSAELKAIWQDLHSIQLRLRAASERSCDYLNLMVTHAQSPVPGDIVESIAAIQRERKMMTGRHDFVRSVADDLWHYIGLGGPPLWR